MNQANPNSDGPAVISARLFTTHNLCNLTPPPLQREGGVGEKVDQLSGPATYEICYEFSLLPPLPSKLKQLAILTRRFRLWSGLTSSNQSASFFKYIPKRLHILHLPAGGYILSWLKNSGLTFHR